MRGATLIAGAGPDDAGREVPECRGSSGALQAQRSEAKIMARAQRGFIRCRPSSRGEVSNACARQGKRHLRHVASLPLG